MPFYARKMASFYIIIPVTYDFYEWRVETSFQKKGNFLPFSSQFVDKTDDKTDVLKP